MAQTGFTPILVYASGTATNVPLAANLTSSASGAELALNYADGKLYFKNSSGVVTLLASSATVAPVTTFSAGTTGFTPSTATSGAVTLAGTLATTNGGTGLTSFTANRVFYSSSTSAIGQSANLTFDGTTLTANALTTTSTVTINGGAANGVAYLNGSKVLTTGSALTFDGTNFSIGGGSNSSRFNVTNGSSGGFEINPDGTGSGPTLIAYNRTGAAYLQLTSLALNHVWQNSSTETMRLTSTGLGIGTSSPGARLHVDSGSTGLMSLLNSTNANGGYITGQSSSTAVWDLGTAKQALNVGGASDFGINVRSGFLSLGTGNTERMRLDSSGNLGIGTSSPQARLHINSGAGSTQFRMGPNSTSSDRALINYNSTTNRFTIDMSGNDAVVVDGSGNLGIGTSSPSSFSGYTTVSVNNATNGGIYNILVNGTETARLQAYSGIFNVAAKGAATNLTFETNGSERMRLDSSGNLGLGVTPSAWTTFKVMQLGNYGAVGGVDSTSMNMFANTFYDGAFKRINAAASTRYRMDEGHSWFTAPSGTAGQTITFTQAMTLDANGDFLIGTTSAPANGANARNVVFNNPNSVPTYVKISNGATGATASDGFDLIMGTSSDAYVYNRENGPMIFGTNGTERARITSGGNLLVGTTSFSFSSNGVQIGADGRVWNTSNIDYNFELAGSTGNRIRFYTSAGGSGATVGSITVSTTATAYNTSSDYRLKDNAQPLTGSGAFIDALQPKTWDWKDIGGKGVGFIAHEVQEISPGSVVGAKDAVDAEGNPVMQAMEYGSAEFIANIVAELQSLRARVAQLESKGA